MFIQNQSKGPDTLKKKIESSVINLSDNKGQITE